MEKGDTTEKILQFLQGRLKHKEIVDFKEWILKDSENHKLFNEIGKVWIETTVYDANISLTETEKSWKALADKIKQRRTYYRYRPFRKVFLTKNILKIAATWAILIAIGAFGSWFFMQSQSKQYNNGTSEMATTMGSRSTVLLPDGSKVWLNAGSKIRYSQKSFRMKREVYLEGEAFFDVVKDKQCVFKVITSDINVLVYGTQFNVRSYPDEDKIQTTLLNGSVAIEQNRGVIGSRKLYIKPNQTATYYKPEREIVKNLSKDKKKIVDEIQKQREQVVISDEVNSIPLTSWKDERWIIVAKEFDELAIDMERRYNVKINFRDEELRNFNFSGTLTNETFDQVMKIIQLSAPVKFDYSIKNNEVDIFYNHFLLKNE